MSRMLRTNRRQDTRTAARQRREARTREHRTWRAETVWLAGHWREVQL